MLDYVYALWDNEEKPITAENVVVLEYLGRYFGVRGLRKEARFLGGTIIQWLRMSSEPSTVRALQTIS